MVTMKRQCRIYIPALTFATALLFPTAAISAPTAKMIIGSDACPKLNEHDRKACRFKRKGHNFQVWPGRISIEATSDPAVWFVTGSGHKDGMFDHVLDWRKDDHVTFQCFVHKDGRYYGPVGFQINRGGVWKTYGTEIKTAAAAVSGAVAAYFATPASAPAAATAGGEAAELLGTALSKLPKHDWEMQAKGVAGDICNALAK